MKKYTTAQRLKQLMDIRGLRQVDILQAAVPYCAQYNVKLNKSDLSQYISGKIEPKQDKLTVLGLALGVSETWLMGFDVDMHRTTSHPVTSPDNIYRIETKRFPVLGNIACGEPILADEHIELYIEAGTNIPADFVLRAKGDSMIGARIQDGDFVFIRQQDAVVDGEIAAVLIDDEATLKRVYYDKEAGVLTLCAENPAYRIMRYSGEDLDRIRILGKAIAFQSDVR